MASRDRTDIAVPLSRRNYLINIVNGALSWVGVRATDAGTVLPLLALRLTGAEWAVGLVQAVPELGRVTASVIAARLLDPVPRKLPVYALWSVVRALALAVTTALLLLGVGRNPWLVFWCVLASLTMLSVGHGVSDLTWSDITARSMPSTRRGTLWMWRRISGLLLVMITAAPLVDYLLGPRSPLPFPRNYGVLYLVTTVSWSAAWLVYTFTREPASHAAKRRLTVAQHMGRALRIVRRDRSYRRLLRLRILNGIAGAVPTFFIVFANQAFGHGEALAALYLSLRTVSELLAGVIFGRLSDAHGNRITILVANWCGLATFMLATAAAAVAPASPNLGVWLLGAAFCALGFLGPGRETGETNYLLDIAPALKRPSYIGFSNAFLLPMTVLPVAVGALAPHVGYLALFGAAAFVALLAILLGGHLPEPRDELMPRGDTVALGPRAHDDSGG
jgi:MFS family permease